MVSTVHYRHVYVYMLGTILKPPARFKAVRTVLKPSGLFQSRPDGFEAVGAINLRFQSRLAGRLRNGPHTVHVHIHANRGFDNFEAAYSKKGLVSEL